MTKKMKMNQSEQKRVDALNLYLTEAALLIVQPGLVWVMVISSDDSSLLGYWNH